MTPERIAELRQQAESFSGLQYVVTRSELQWPWTSAPTTNQVIDLVRALPAVLDDLAAAVARAAALEAERDVLVLFAQMSFAAEYWFASGHPNLTPEMAGDWETTCEQVRAILAGQPAADGGGVTNSAKEHE